MRRWLMVMVTVLLGLGSTGMAAAQGYPARPITMIVPFPAGGATDTLARFLAERMRGILGQPVIIENIAGAAGSIGVGRAVRSPADGYTLSIGTSTTHMLVGGLYALQIDFMIEPSSNFKSLVGAGSVKPYAITGRARLLSSPDIPTADEAGLPGFFASLWYRVCG